MIPHFSSPMNLVVMATQIPGTLNQHSPAILNYKYDVQGYYSLLDIPHFDLKRSDFLAIIHHLSLNLSPAMVEMVMLIPQTPNLASLAAWEQQWCYAAHCYYLLEISHSDWKHSKSWVMILHLSLNIFRGMMSSGTTAMQDPFPETPNLVSPAMME